MGHLGGSHLQAPTLEKTKLIVIKHMWPHMIAKFCHVACKSYRTCEMEEMNESCICESLKERW